MAAPAEPAAEPLAPVPGPRLAPPPGLAGMGPEECSAWLRGELAAYLVGAFGRDEAQQLLRGALAAAGGGVPGLFTRDPGVAELVSGVVWTFVVVTQPINSAAFVWDGVLFGAGGFKYACFQMAASCLPSVALMLLAVGRAGPDAPPSTTLTAVWAGLGLVMLLRWLTIWGPYSARAGPFQQLWPAAPAADGGPAASPAGKPAE